MRKWPDSRSEGRTLKLPLVAGTQPRAAHQRAVEQSACTSDEESDFVSGQPSAVIAVSVSIAHRAPNHSLRQWTCGKPPPHYNGGLLDQAHRERIDVVLVSPRNPLNIGAAARAMANFGFARLTVVAPYEEHWREARSAVGAPEVLAEARETATLAESLANCTLAIGTGMLTARRPEQHVVSLPDLAPLVEHELQAGGRVAIVFGSEKRGLTREDLSRCHLLAEIPTDAGQPSMNLGQAVAVCLYELATRVILPGVSRSDGTAAQAPQGSSAARGAEIDMLAGVIADTMDCGTVFSRGDAGSKPARRALAAAAAQPDIQRCEACARALSACALAAQTTAVKPRGLVYRNGTSVTAPHQMGGPPEAPLLLQSRSRARNETGCSKFEIAGMAQPLDGGFSAHGVLLRRAASRRFAARNRAGGQRPAVRRS